MEETYDLVLVGTGFASSFFLHEYLRNAGPKVRVLVLERGPRRDHFWHLANAETAEREANASFKNSTPEKPWVFRLAFGGSSSCWWACTPRLLPADFRTKSTYGVSADWPVTYDELEEFYCEAEEIMAISGPEHSPFPRSRPYPQPPHRLSDPDRLLQAAFPDSFFVQPAARPTRNVASGRPRCCASGVCDRCPIDSKFTILNEMSHLFEADERVAIEYGAEVRSIEFNGNAARAVSYVQDGEERSARGDLFGLGANAIFNPFILLKSGLEHPQLGAGLVEQVSMVVNVLLDGVDNFSGSTSITGHGYMQYDGDHRKTRPAALIETVNVPQLRDVRGKWRQQMLTKFIFEDLRQDGNRVRVSSDDPTRPEVVYGGHSDYAQRGIDALPDLLPGVLAPLPVEETRTFGPLKTDSHIMGTTVMGEDPTESIVDRHLLHHKLRNLYVMGTSCFPTVSPANPTLTLTALSLRAARHALGAS